MHYSQLSFKTSLRTAPLTRSLAADNGEEQHYWWSLHPVAEFLVVDPMGREILFRPWQGWVFGCPGLRG